MRMTRRGAIQRLRRARLGASVWLCALTAGLTVLPLLHTAFHDQAHAHGTQHHHASDHHHARFTVPVWAQLAGVFGDDEVVHRHGDASHTHAPEVSDLESLDPVLAIQLGPSAPAHHGSEGDHHHGGHSHPAHHGEGSLEHLDVALLAAVAPALLPPSTAIDGEVPRRHVAPAVANYLLSPVQPQAPPAADSSFEVAPAA